MFEGPAKLHAEFESKWNAWEQVSESIWWQNQLTTHPPTAGRTPKKKDEPAIEYPYTMLNKK